MAAAGPGRSCGRPRSLSSRGADGFLASRLVVVLRRRPRRRAVGGQRVADRPGLVERSLRHAHRNGRCVGGETGDDPQRGENVVGSYGRGYLPDNHVQYRTPADGHRRTDLGADQRGADVDACAGRPWSAARRRPRSRPSRARTASCRRRGRRRGVRRASARPAFVRRASRARPRPPRGCPARRAARRRAPRGSLRSTLAGEPDLEVLGLAGHAGRRGPDVADLRMRAEAGRVGHRHLGAAQRPLEGPREVTVGR